MTEPEPHEYDLARMFDAYVDTHGRPASTLDGVGNVAFAALAMLCGCPMDRVGDLHHRMVAHSLPPSPQYAVDQFTSEVRRMLDGGH